MYEMDTIKVITQYLTTLHQLPQFIWYCNTRLEIPRRPKGDRKREQLDKMLFVTDTANTLSVKLLKGLEASKQGK